MSNKFKEIDLKNHTYYFFDDMINIKNLDPNKIKIYKKSNQSILIHIIRYVTIKDLIYVKINSVNPLFVIVDKINGYIEGSNGSKLIKAKTYCKSVKNCGVKSEVLLGQ